MLQHYFDEFGHKCNLNLNKPFYEYEKNKNRFQLWIMKYSLISPKFILQRGRPRTFGALRSEMLDQLQHHPSALHPFSFITFYCETIWMIAVFLLLVLLPFEIFYLKDAGLNWHHQPNYVNMMLSAICIFDCIRRFFTGYLIQHVDKEEIVLDFKRISINYLTGYFWIDFLSTLPSFIQMWFLTSPNYFLALELISFLKFFRIFSMLKVLRNVMQYRRSNYNFDSILNWIILLGFTVHWVSCFSMLVGIIHKRFNPTSVQWYDDYEKMSLINMYLTCLHRSTSVLSGTGFKFIKGNETRTVNDILYTMFTAVLGHILTTIIFAKISQKIIGMRSASAKYEDMLTEVSEYIKHLRLRETTQNKIKTYYAYKYDHSYFNEHEILGAIPNVLRENILLHCAKLLLENEGFFKKLPASLVANIVSHFRREVVVSGDVISCCGQKGIIMFFLISGTVASFTCSGRELFHLEDGSYFGQAGIVSRGRFELRVDTKVAIETCELFILSASEFYVIQNYCPDLVKEMEKLVIDRYNLNVMLEERYERLLNRQLSLQQRGEGVDFRFSNVL